MHPRKFALALVAMLALAALVAGCGGGSSSSDSSTSAESESSSTDAGGEAPTKSAFISEADKICGDADAALNKEVTDYAEENGIPITGNEKPTEDQEIEIFQAVVLPNIGRQAEDIAALTPPEGEEETVEDLTDTLSSEVAELEEEGGILGKGTLAGATEKAKAYGLNTCGS
jgi:ABC-type glycerol-3-phosphate transport system substrate-binding protein